MLCFCYPLYEGWERRGCVKCSMVVMEERQLPVHVIHPIANLYTDPWLKIIWSFPCFQCFRSIPPASLKENLKQTRFSIKLSIFWVLQNHKCSSTLSALNMVLLGNQSPYSTFPIRSDSVVYVTRSNSRDISRFVRKLFWSHYVLLVLFIINITQFSAPGTKSTCLSQGRICLHILSSKKIFEKCVTWETAWPLKYNVTYSYYNFYLKLACYVVTFLVISNLITDTLPLRVSVKCWYTVYVRFP
jgi:hypothetical protein